MYNIYIIFREYLCNLYIDYSRNTVYNIITGKENTTNKTGGKLMTDKELLEMYENLSSQAKIYAAGFVNWK